MAKKKAFEATPQEETPQPTEEQIDASDATEATETTPETPDPAPTEGAGEGASDPTPGAADAPGEPAAKPAKLSPAESLAEHRRRAEERFEMVPGTWLWRQMGGARKPYLHRAEIHRIGYVPERLIDKGLLRKPEPDEPKKEA